ncbi:apolipoprotein N-acyltransferase [Paraphotobacterium marinum]|uniref:Apolipoprotein N-acyltransferase n=1 Tax=Paraphotobacterium marinum TaxID=1755811 RepID=A0A220VBR6_9GAMM|nr:apolipoprotein N-acyltransferase [Paraphotobacterium marinum]ASK77779.1 apolipoprotein N-acyltransferase [Paraphotobacterium marinum]
MFKYNKLVLILFSFISGAISTLSFAPYSLWFCSFISIFILLAILDKSKTNKNAFSIGFFWGLGQFYTGVSWIWVSMHLYGGMSWYINIFLISALIFYLSVYPALFGYFYNKLKKRNYLNYLVIAPLLWILQEQLRGHLFTGFPWLSLGYSQINSPISSLAPIIGVTGLSYLVIFISGFLLLFSKTRNLKVWVTIIPIVCITIVFYNKVWTTPKENKKFQVYLIQGDIKQSTKWDPDYISQSIEKYINLTIDSIIKMKKQKSNHVPAIIIWPEAALSIPENQISSTIKEINSIGNKNNVVILTGSIYSHNGKFYNSIIALGSKNQTNNNEYQRYMKHHLLPFGEYVPFSNLLRKLGPFFNLPMSDFTPGKYKQNNFNANGIIISADLCYEILFPEQIRNNVNSDTDVLLTLSDDTWFGKSIGPSQHMQIAQMRALELGKPLLRGTNSGITAVVNIHGKIEKRLPMFKTDILQAEVMPYEGMTPYGKFGYLLTSVFILLNIFWGLIFSRFFNCK